MQIALAKALLYALLNGYTKILDPNWLQHALRLMDIAPSRMLGFLTDYRYGIRFATEVIAKMSADFRLCFTIKREGVERLDI
jgi:hypothetical protein